MSSFLVEGVVVETSDVRFAGPIFSAIAEAGVLIHQRQEGAVLVWHLAFHVCSVLLLRLLWIQRHVNNYTCWPSALLDHQRQLFCNSTFFCARAVICTLLCLWRPSRRMAIQYRLNVTVGVTCT